MSNAQFFPIGMHSIDSFAIMRRSIISGFIHVFCTSELSARMVQTASAALLFVHMRSKCVEPPNGFYVFCFTMNDTHYQPTLSGQPAPAVTGDAALLAPTCRLTVKNSGATGLGMVVCVTWVCPNCSGVSVE